MTDPGPPPAEPASPEDQPDASGRPVPPPPELTPRTRTVRFAWAAVAIILIGVIVLVVYALTGSTPAQDVAHPATTSAGVVSELAAVPPATFDAVGATTTPPVALEQPTVLVDQPPLTALGKPQVLFVGAEYCPFCAAERWPLIVALSRFGRFRRLFDMQSAPQSVFPGIQTFTFAGTDYASRYLTLTGVELYSDGTDPDGAYARLATLGPEEQSAVDRYHATGADGTLPGAYPFVDIGNKLVTSTSAFSPTLLVRQSQGAIAGSLAHAQAPIGQAIVAAANVLTAGMCMATDQQPAQVCTSRGVRSAFVALAG